MSCKPVILSVFLCFFAIGIAFSYNNTTTESTELIVSSNTTFTNNSTIPSTNQELSDNSSTKIFKILPDKTFKWSEHRDILPKIYAQVIEQPAPLYSVPWDNPANKKIKRYLDGGFLWVSIESPIEIKSGNFTWYLVNKNEFIQKKYLAFYEPSSFKGIDLNKLKLNGQFGWLVLDTYTAATPGKQDYMEGELIEKHTLVKIADTVFINGKKWLKLAEKRWVEGSRVALITKAERPSKISDGVKWIDINIYEQVLSAYEGDKMVFVTLISTGLPSFDTPLGVFRIWGKARMRKMSGGEKNKDYYFLEDVPYQMYFSNGVAIHGAYWHDNFGIRQSHGCVNVSPRDAKWLFEWTSPKVVNNNFIKSTRSNPGTFVYVH